MDLITLALSKNYTDKRIEKAQMGEMELDTTLTKQGFAADAKAVGDAIAAGTDGIHVGTDEPTNPNVSVWIDTDETDVTDYIPTPTTAQVGQTIVVKEVDEYGKPVAWECADIASGGGGNEWELITEITTTEEVAGGIVITQNDNGISLSELKYTEIWYMAKMEGVSTNTHNWWEVAINTDDTNVKCVSASSGGTAARRYVHLYAFLRGGKLYFSNTNANPFVISGGSDNWLHNYLDYNIATYITSLTISANSNAVVGVDSEIKILGRRGH